MQWKDWYTDLMDIYRVTEVQDGALTRHEREQVAADIPCRIYQSDSKAVNMTQTAANVQQQDKLACDVSVDVRAGDELMIHRADDPGLCGRPDAVL